MTTSRRSLASRGLFLLAWAAYTLLLLGLARLTAWLSKIQIDYLAN